MKKLSKAIVLLLSAIMVLAMSTSVFAGTIEVQDVIDGETYTAYKILNYRDSGTGEERVVSYYLTSGQYTSIGSVLEAAGFSFTASSDGTEYFVNNADALKNSGVSEIAAYLGSHLSELGDALGKYTAEGADGSAVFTDLSPGYYFVTSTAGSLCALHEDSDIATVVEKNTVPTVDKKEKTSGNDYVDGPVYANFGDTVHYQLTVTDGIGTDKAITLTDTMSAGLDYKAGTIKINDTSVADSADTANWSVSVSGRVITIVFKPAYVASLDKDAKITVTYDATLNKNAVVDDNDANSNSVKLTYSEQSQDDIVYVGTYDFQVFKTDGTKFLDGSEFKLYDAQTRGNQIILSSDNTGYYVDPAGSATTTIDINSEAGCNVRGLAPGTYYLEEVVVPAGYNKLPSRIEVDITSDQTDAVTVTVVNNAGAELPSTGGIGTVIFYVLGSALLIGCGIVLISRKRMQK